MYIDPDDGINIARSAIIRGALPINSATSVVLPDIDAPGMTMAFPLHPATPACTNRSDENRATLSCNSRPGGR